MLGIPSCFAPQEEGQEAAVVSVLSQVVNPAEGVNAWLLLPFRSGTHKENAAERSDVLEEREKCVRSEEKSALPWQ